MPHASSRRLPYLCMLLQVLGALERLVTERARKRFRAHMDAQMRREVVALLACLGAAGPSAAQDAVVLGLAANMILAQMSLRNLFKSALRDCEMPGNLHRAPLASRTVRCSPPTGNALGRCWRLMPPRSSPSSLPLDSISFEVQCQDFLTVTCRKSTTYQVGAE